MANVCAALSCYQLLMPALDMINSKGHPNTILFLFSVISLNATNVKKFQLEQVFNCKMLSKIIIAGSYGAQNSATKSSCCRCLQQVYSKSISHGLNLSKTFGGQHSSCKTYSDTI
jgi:hypothetical protein